MRGKLEVQVLRVVLQLLLQKPMFQYRPLRSLLDILCQPNRRILTLEILMASVSICRQQHFSLCHSNLCLYILHLYVAVAWLFLLMKTNLLSLWNCKTWTLNFHCKNRLLRTLRLVLFLPLTLLCLLLFLLAKKFRYFQWGKLILGGQSELGHRLQRPLKHLWMPLRGSQKLQSRLLRNLLRSNCLLIDHASHHASANVTCLCSAVPPFLLCHF
ncbi:unnamed protein product [Linum tenue]|uniref:Uncharacterized protein n=1 Tax=Linum tenue TaxID=586396 RepID=A0AAV0NAX5_9ROSI|nr:unnamed protein product [Linum tenue]